MKSNLSLRAFKMTQIDADVMGSILNGDIFKVFIHSNSIPTQILEPVHTTLNILE